MKKAIKITGDSKAIENLIREKSLLVQRGVLTIEEIDNESDVKREKVVPKSVKKEEYDFSGNASKGKE